jgi:hypothetical protein
VAVNNSIKIGPLVFLLYMFVITENIMKCSVYMKSYFAVIQNISVNTVNRLRTGGFGVRIPA